MPTAFAYPDKCARAMDKDKACERPMWHSVTENVGNSDSSSVSSSDDPMEAKKSEGPMQARRTKIDNEGATQVPTHTLILSFHFFYESTLTPTHQPTPYKASPAQAQARQ